MPVEVRTLRDEAARAASALAAGKFLVTERLCRSSEGLIVSEDRCVNGGTLLYTPGMEIPLAEARLVGLIPEVTATPTVAPAAPPLPRKRK